MTGNTDNVCQRVPAAPHRVAQQHLEAGLILQERQEGHLPNHDHPQPLRLALQHEEDILHGQVSFPAYFMSYLLKYLLLCPCFSFSRQRKIFYVTQKY